MNEIVVNGDPVRSTRSFVRELFCVQNGFFQKIPSLNRLGAAFTRTLRAEQSFCLVECICRLCASRIGFVLGPLEPLDERAQ